MILSNIYHREPEPDNTPRVPLLSVKPGQTYVHELGGFKRTVIAHEPGKTKVYRHDDKGLTYTEITCTKSLQKKVIIV